ncbi:brain mitochondrial carrier protein 1 isoform X3 [Python bivittatus]|uniref:Brain mitochondrial carrier protein 1 isoform X3 n=1 Tax=Python bivittatus TaxID=176946 RepID=A0A9F5MVZ7_PYTBI|nr:brain mitochondrial carrier protein 1 isoform X3 [Python bivittatus]
MDLEPAPRPLRRTSPRWLFCISRRSPSRFAGDGKVPLPRAKRSLPSGLRPSSFSHASPDLAENPYRRRRRGRRFFSWRDFWAPPLSHWPVHPQPTGTSRRLVQSQASRLSSAFSEPPESEPLYFNTFGLSWLPSAPSRILSGRGRNEGARLARRKNEAAPGKGGGGPPAPFLLSRNVRTELEAVCLRRVGLARGRIRIAPALLRQASYGTIKIGIYQSLKRLFVNRLEDETLLINVICGVISGVISSALANPTDVLKMSLHF